MADREKTCERFAPDPRGWKYGAYQVNKLLQDVEYAKDILQGKQEQCSADYRIWEILNNISSFLKLFMDGNNTGK